MDAETKAALDAVNTKIDALTTGLPDVVANAVKPIVEAQEAAASAAKEAEAAERKTLTDKIVNAAARDADECALLPIANLRKIAEGVTPGKAAPIGNGAGDPGGKVTFRVPGSKKEA